MSSSRFRPELYRAVIHPAMSISVAASGILATAWLIAVNFGATRPPLALILSVILAPALEAVAGNILYRERAGIGNRVRELVIFQLLLYLLLALFEPGSLSERLIPSGIQAATIAASTLAWVTAFSFHNRLRGREALLRTFGRKQGAELRRAVLERQHDMALTVAQLRRARSLITSVFVNGCVLAVLAALNPIRVSRLSESPGAFASLILFGIATVAVTGTLNAFIEEYAANGEGLAVPLRFQRRRFLAGLSMLLVVLVLAFGLSRTQGALPLEAIVDFFRWLSDRFTRAPQEIPIELPTPERSQNEVTPEMLRLLQELEDAGPPLWLRILGRLLERLGIIAIVLGGAVLLFGPLFSPDFRTALRELHALQKIRAFFRALRQRLRILRRFLRAGFRGRRHEREDEIKAAPADQWRSQAWKPSLQKRLQMDRVVRVFADLARWGSRHGVPYSRTEAAREYLSRVATLHPERYADAMTVAQTFCEARFSRHVLSRERMRQYVGAAKRITSAR